MSPTTDHNFRYPALTDTPNVPRDIQALAVDIAAYVDVHPGPQGIQGTTGMQGVQGPQGLQGRQGTQGVQGTQGLQGLQGILGLQGPVGQAGTQNAHAAINAVSVANGTGTSTYFAGSADAENGTGVGAYIEANANGTIPTIDGVTLAVGNRVLFTNRANLIENGIYSVTSLGSGSTKYRFTRSTDYDNSTLLEVEAGDYVYALTGTAYAGSTWVQIKVGSNVDGSIRIGTDQILFTQSSGIGAQGTNGTQGTQGVQGLQGLQGSQGTNGIQGAQGILGTQGTYITSANAPSSPLQGLGWLNLNDGHLYLWSGTEWFEPYNNFTGLQGAQGVQGVYGPPTIPQNSQTTSYTLALTDVGKHVSITTGGVTVPPSIFNSGDNIMIYNNSSSSQTITQGSGVTLRLAGTSSFGNRTLSQYGLTSILCVASNVFVISGSGLS